MNYTFDPIQFKEFGYLYAHSNEYAYRYQANKRLLLTNLYIPQGPNSTSKEAFESFIKEITKKKLTKIIIDLPLILDKDIKDEVTTLLLENGFKQRSYIQDEETILIQKSNFICEKKVRWYIRKAQDSINTVVKTDLTVQDVKDIYQVYLESANRIKYEPKSIAAFQKLSEKCIVSLSYSKETSKLVGFTFGYVTELPLKKDSTRLLQTIFAGTTQEGMKLNSGYATYFALIDHSLNNYNIDFFDFHGASRTKNRDYTTFKTKFGGEFYSLAGSFEKLNLF